MSTNEVLTLAISTVVAGIALATLVQACMEYIRQGRMGRAQMFFELRERLKQEPLAELAEAIDEAGCGDPVVAAEAREKLLSTPLRTKRDYLGLFEEVDIAMGSGLIKPEIANYMFGYYALRCAECDAFWDGVNRLSPYWNRFFDFCRKMQIEDARVLMLETRPPIPLLLPRQHGARATAREDAAAAANQPHTVTIHVPPALRAAAGGDTRIDVQARTVGEALTALAERHPPVGEQLFATGHSQAAAEREVRRYINVYLNDQDVRFGDGLATEVADGSVIHVLPNASGG